MPRSASRNSGTRAPLKQAPARRSYMRRIAASKFHKYQPESDRARPSLLPARRAPLRPGRKARRPRRLPYRAGFRPPPRAPQSRLRIPGGAANQVQPAWDVVDDFPEDIPVMPRELKVIETYLAAVLDESLEPMSLEAEKAAIETVKPDLRQIRSIDSSWPEPT
jgi:hypothetical protein